MDISPTNMVFIGSFRGRESSRPEDSTADNYVDGDVYGGRVKAR